MEREVEAVALDLLSHPQAHRPVDHLEDHEADGAPIDDGHQNAVTLHPELRQVAFKKARLAADLGGGEDPGQKRADDAADAVHAEDIERIVATDQALEARGPPPARRPGDEAYKERAGGGDEPR